MLGMRTIVFAAAAALMAMTGATAAGRQAAAAQPSSGEAPQMAEKVFKNIQVLKGITVDEFMDTMGMFAAATTKDCTGCHAPEILSGSRDAFATTTPMIQRARQMTVMMNTINRNFFGNQARVTCYTCHSATSSPQRVPNLSIQYGTPPPDNPDRLEFIALPDRANEVDGIFARLRAGDRRRRSDGRPSTASRPPAPTRAGIRRASRSRSNCSAAPRTSSRRSCTARKATTSSCSTD